MGKGWAKTVGIVSCVDAGGDVRGPAGAEVVACESEIAR